MDTSSKQIIRIQMGYGDHLFISWRSIEAHVIGGVLGVHQQQYILMDALLNRPEKYDITHLPTGRTVARGLNDLESAMQCADELWRHIDFNSNDPKDYNSAERDFIVNRYKRQNNSAKGGDAQV